MQNKKAMKPRGLRVIPIGPSARNTPRIFLTPNINQGQIRQKKTKTFFVSRKITTTVQAIERIINTIKIPPQEHAKKTKNKGADFRKTLHPETVLGV